MNTFQDQEYEKETGWVKFKWRNHDPAIGRFFNVDPLAEDYVYNSVYAFSENKVINGIELEGLEWEGFMTSFLAQTQAVAQSSSDGNPSVGDYIQAAANVAFYSTGIGQGLNNIQAGATSRVGNEVSHAMNSDSMYENAVNSNSDPNQIASNYEATNNAANLQIVEGSGQALVSAVAAQGALFTGALEAAPSAPTVSSSAMTRSNSPSFIVDEAGTAFPVPKGATGPSPVVNKTGNQTGVAFTGGQGGTNGQVSTMRIMNATPARGNSPGYPNGYVKYENAGGQGVNPISGRTGSRSETHFTLQSLYPGGN